MAWDVAFLPSFTLRNDRDITSGFNTVDLACRRVEVISHCFGSELSMHDRDESTAQGESPREANMRAAPDGRVAPGQASQLAAQRRMPGDKRSATKDEAGRIVPTMWR
jgi:hypothetical protein